MSFETVKVFQFGPIYFFYNLIQKRNDIRFDDIEKEKQFEKFIVEKSKKLRKSKIPNFFQVEEILKNVATQSFDDLTAIDRIYGHPRSNLQKIPIFVKEIRNEFLSAPVYMSELEKEYVHPMDILNRTLEGSEPESARILTENLDKMKFALPFVFPCYTGKSKLRLWPLVGINRQTRDRKFNMFQVQHSHHVVACVRLGHSDGLFKKLSSHSKSEIANEIFFKEQPKFISRNSHDLGKTLRRNALGSIETAINSPNKIFDEFFQVWNMHGNIMYDGLKPQVELISKSATSIIVILDDDKEIQFMEKKIKEFFGSERVIVLIPGSVSQSGSDSESDEDNTLLTMNSVQCVNYRASQKQEAFRKIRSFIKNIFQTKPTFNFLNIVSNPNWSNYFDFDFEESTIKPAKTAVEDLMTTLNNLRHLHASTNLQQHCFPLYFSTSPLDRSMKIVEHIESLE